MPRLARTFSSAADATTSTFHTNANWNPRPRILRETLQRVAKIELKTEIQLHASPPWNYRNRTRLQVQTNPEFALAYFRFGSHELLPVRECPISSPLINRAIMRLIELCGCECPAAIEEIEFFADAADEHLLAWAFCGRDADQKILLRWAEMLQKECPEIAGVTFFASRRRSEDEEPTDMKRLAQSGAQEIRYQTRGAESSCQRGRFSRSIAIWSTTSFRPSSRMRSGERALDLYAGVGLFSTALAPSFHHIFAVEASQTSHGDLIHNAAANVKAVRARTEDYLQSAPVRKRPELVVVDPPRTGVGKAVIRSLVDLGATRIRYVSCDPATLARDLTPLLAAGYRVEEAHLFDLFPQTFHIESVLLLERGRS